jgi:hypothetical protein
MCYADQWLDALEKARTRMRELDVDPKHSRGKHEGSRVQNPELQKH